nr:hypothetical protein [Ningiella sp. W23]
MTQDKANRLGANSIADAIATETAALKQRFEPQIKQAQQQIAALTQKNNSLISSLNCLFHRSNKRLDL